MKSQKFSIILFLVLAVSLAGFYVLAGTISNSSSPVPTGYTLTDIYNLIQNNATTTPGNHDFYPGDVPRSSLHSISELYVDLANLIDPAKLSSSSVEYLGVTGGGFTPTPVSALTKHFTPITTRGSVTDFTLSDVYNLIQSNTRPTTPAHTFAPAGSPADSGPSLTDIYNALKPGSFITAGTIASGTRYLGVIGTYVPEFCGGDGSSGSPYQICTWANLNNVRNHLSSYFILDNNLSSADSDYAGLGNSWVPIGDCGPDNSCWDTGDNHPFTGNFNGNGSAVSNFEITLPSAQGVGLFGITYGNISNIGVTSVNVLGSQNVGGLVGMNFGTINNSYYASGIFSAGGGGVGGLVGMNIGTISNSYSIGGVSASSYVGGLAGANSGGTISNCYSTGNVSGSSNVGGLVSTLR